MLVGKRLLSRLIFLGKWNRERERERFSRIKKDIKKTVLWLGSYDLLKKSLIYSFKVKLLEKSWVKTITASSHKILCYPLFWVSLPSSKKYWEILNDKKSLVLSSQNACCIDPIMIVSISRFVNSNVSLAISHSYVKYVSNTPRSSVYRENDQEKHWFYQERISHTRISYNWNTHANRDGIFDRYQLLNVVFIKVCHCAALYVWCETAFHQEPLGNEQWPQFRCFYGVW